MKKYTPRVKPEDFRAWNDKMITKYDPDAFHHHPNFFVRFTERKRVKIIFKMMNINHDDHVFEIGCGAGNVIEKAPHGKPFGADISLSVLFKARQRICKKVHLFQADAQNLPCKDQAFMQVICSEVLEHLLDPSAALKEMARILKPQGTVVASVPNESLINRVKSILIHLGVFGWLFRRKGNYAEMSERMDHEWHLHDLRLEGWLTLFDDFFRVAQMRRIPFFWLPLRYAVRLEKSDGKGRSDEATIQN